MTGAPRAARVPVNLTSRSGFGLLPFSPREDGLRRLATPPTGWACWRAAVRRRRSWWWMRWCKLETTRIRQEAVITAERQRKISRPTPAGALNPDSLKW